MEIDPFPVGISLCTVFRYWQTEDVIKKKKKIFLLHTVRWSMGKYLLMNKIDQDSVHLKTRAPGEKLSGRPLIQQVPDPGPGPQHHTIHESAQWGIPSGCRDVILWMCSRTNCYAILWVGPKPRSWTRDSSMVKQHLFLQSTRVQFLTPTWWLAIVCNSCSRGTKASSDIFGQQAGTWHTHTCAHTHTGTHTHGKQSHT